ncbi:hypothetical protein [Butyricimonas paravirosa]
MRSIIKSVFTLLCVLILFSFESFSQEVKEVTLTVSGDGVSKQEAIANALRSAIEQAFGTFISANTSILNDELVKDEIVSITTGNIKEYHEITEVHLPNNRISVTIRVVVSISKLINYCKNKGSSVEFAGQTFAMNVKLKELNRTNSQKALENLMLQLETIGNDMFDYQLATGEPVMEGDFYKIPTTIRLQSNNNTHLFYETLLGTLNSLSLSPNEIEECRKMKFETYSFTLTGLGNALIKKFTLWTDFDIIELESIIKKAILNFKISDNMGGCSFIDFKSSKIYPNGLIKIKKQPVVYNKPWLKDVHNMEYIYVQKVVPSERDNTVKEDITLEYYPSSRGEYIRIPHFSSLVNAPSMYKTNLFKNLEKKGNIRKTPKSNKSFLCYELVFPMYIPKNDIANYSNFEIQSK